MKIALNKYSSKENVQQTKNKHGNFIYLFNEQQREA